MNQEAIMSFVRHMLTFAGGILVTKGILDEGTSMEVIGGLMTVIGAIWGIVAKLKS